MRIKRRNGLVSALLGLVTCGLYHIFFLLCICSKATRQTKALVSVWGRYQLGLQR